MGNFGDMASAGSLHEYLQQLTNEFGAVGAFWWGETRVAYITSQRVLLDTQNAETLRFVSDRPALLFEGFKPMIGEHSIQYANGKEFHTKYAVYRAAFQKDMRSKVAVMTKLVGSTVTKWRRLIQGIAQ